jgi:hypothetical protein
MDVPSDELQLDFGAAVSGLQEVEGQASGVAAGLFEHG